MGAPLIESRGSSFTYSDLLHMAVDEFRGLDKTPAITALGTVLASVEAHRQYVLGNRKTATVLTLSAAAFMAAGVNNANSGPEPRKLF